MKKELMKRDKSCRFEQIVDYANLRLAWYKSLRGKRKKLATRHFAANLEKNLEIIRSRLFSGDPGWGHYETFTIHDPKLRTIRAVPFDQRIMHHAIMNILDPVFDRHQIFHSYACRKGKGTHAALYQAFHNSKSQPYFIKLDVTKYFDSVSHFF